jgi:hypothetical protein
MLTPGRYVGLASAGESDDFEKVFSELTEKLLEINEHSSLLDQKITTNLGFLKS